MIMCACTTEVDEIVVRGGCGHLPPEGNQAEGGERRSGLRRIAYLRNN